MALMAGVASGPVAAASSVAAPLLRLSASPAAGCRRAHQRQGGEARLSAQRRVLLIGQGESLSRRRSRREGADACGASTAGRSDVRAEYVETSTSSRMEDLPSLRAESATTHEPQTSAAGHHAGVSYHWNEQWYPVAFARDFDKKRPLAVTMFDVQYALFYDGKRGEFMCVEDRCPHRLAPLSEGRVTDDGQIQCPYHGWEFDGKNGQVTHIPQMPKSEVESGGMKSLSSRGCAKSIPTMEKQGMVWIWPGPSDKADPAKAVLIEELDKEDVVSIDYVRDLPYDYTILVENLMDPAHVPFAHHNTFGNRKTARPLDLEILPATDPTGLSGVTGVFASNKGSADRNTRVSFEPPCLYYNLTSMGDKRIGLFVYCVPVGVGKSRAYVRSTRNFARFARVAPEWMVHQGLNLIMDQDLMYLHTQCELEGLAAHEGNSWRKAYYMPTTSDRFVIEYRKWLDRALPSIPNAAARKRFFEALKPGIRPTTDLGSPEANRHLLLDRFAQHTVHCASCSKAVKGVTFARKGFSVAAVLGAAVSAALITIQAVAGKPLAGVASLFPHAAAWAGLSIVCAVVVWFLKANEEKFYYWYTKDREFAIRQ
eukprot:jgi/Chlat1/5647/Chrsp369S05411